MGIYLGATLWSCVNYFLLTKLKIFKQKKFIKIFISLLPMLVVSAIRYNVGWDYQNIYTNGFFMVGKGYMPHYFSEIPFDWLVKLIYIVSDANPDWLFIICSSITFIFISKAIEEQSSSAVFSILLLFLIRYYYLTLNIVRQGIAISIALYSLKYIKESNFLKYFFTIILASCFHYISLVYIPIYFFAKMNWKKTFNFLLLVLMPILVMVGYWVIMNYTKYGNYIGTKFDGQNFLIHEIILGGFVLFIATIQKKSVKYEKEYYHIYYVLQIITFCFAIGSKVLPVADRLVWTFYTQNIMFIPLIIKNLKNIQEKALIIFIILIITSITIIAQSVIGDSYSIIPYTTIFQN